MQTEIIGPPVNKPTFVSVRGIGVDVMIYVQDDIDAEIVRLALQMAERRRVGKTDC